MRSEPTTRADPDDDDPARPPGARQGAQLPLPGRGAPRPRRARSLDDVLPRSSRAIPPGGSTPSSASARVTLGGEHTIRRLSRDAVAHDRADRGRRASRSGASRSTTREAVPAGRRGPFLNEERNCSRPIADRLGHFVCRRRHAQARARARAAGARAPRRVVESSSTSSADRPRAVGADRPQDDQPPLLDGVDEAERLLRRRHAASLAATRRQTTRTGRGRAPRSRPPASTEAAFRIAARTCRARDPRQHPEVDQRGQVHVSRAPSSTSTPRSPRSPTRSRFHHGDVEENDLSTASRRSARRADPPPLHRPDRLRQRRQGLRRRHRLLRAVPAHHLPAKQPRALGGKSAGLFLAVPILASSRRDQELARRDRAEDLVHDLRRPPRLHHLQRPRGDRQQKYVDLDVRQEYPHIVQIFKNSLFRRRSSSGSPSCSTISRTGRSSCAARASSRTASARPSPASTRASSSPTGHKHERLDALIDAIAEVYASIFGPDPIEYRRERGLSTSTRRWAS